MICEFFCVFVFGRHRCVVGRVRAGGTDARAAPVSGRKRRGPVGGDNKDIGDANARANTRDEPKLYGIQVPTDQTTSLAEGVPP